MPEDKKTSNKKGSFTFYYGEKIDWFKAEAKRRGMSGTGLITVAVEEYLKRHKGLGE